jgi:hypothetical protein
MLAQMDQLPIFYFCVFLLSFAFLYNHITKRIPSRLRPDQAPKSENGFIPAAKYLSPAPAHGTEWACYFPAYEPADLVVALSSYTASGPTLTRRGEQNGLQMR